MPNGSRGDIAGQLRRRAARKRLECIQEYGYPPHMKVYVLKMARYCHWAAVVSGRHASAIRRDAIKAARPKYAWQKSRQIYPNKQERSRAARNRRRDRLGLRSREDYLASVRRVGPKKPWKTTNREAWLHWLREWRLNNRDLYLERQRRHYRTAKGKLAVMGMSVSWFHKLSEEDKCAVRVHVLSQRLLSRHRRMGKFLDWEREALRLLGISETS